MGAQKGDNLTTKGTPSWIVSLVPFVILVSILAVVVKVFGADALGGASQVALLFSAGATVAIAMICYHTPWKDIESAIADNTKTISSAIIILLLIGAISGSWMVSGIVPTMIYYGLKIISPTIFLFATCAICALVSVMTGSSWTTIATIGVALIGIGQAQGYDSGWIAGAIISGAYFGDKISPLSDTTTLASSSSGTPLFTHIRYMMITTIPSFCIALAVFLAASLLHTVPDVSRAEEFSQSLSGTFNISPWLLLVPVATGILIAKRLPALVTLFLAAAMAGIAAVVAQSGIIAQIAGSESINFLDGFKGVMTSYYGDTAINMDNEALSELVKTGGMCGMLNTIFLIICASTFSATLMGSGMLQSLTNLLLRCVHRVVSIVAATVGTGVFCNMVTGDQYLSIILTGSLYKPLYEGKGLENRLLSRSVEDSATVVSVLIPWNSCGMTQSTVLKVPTLEYLPYCVFNILSPLMSILNAAIGYKIFRREV